MRTTLKDVAERAGVSVKTVSNVVNGYVHVRSETRERVQLAIDELKYRPNLSARSLRRGRSGVIALALPEIDVPYFAELARHVVTVAERHGLTVLIDLTEGSPDRERVVVSGIRDQMIDGLILSPLALTAEALAERDVSTPLVLLGERISQAVADHVVIDNVAAARTATEHLIGLGRRRIAAIGTQDVPAGATARLRYQGYAEALEAAGLELDDALAVPATRYRRADGAEAMAALLASDQRPDAVFCFNDLLALGALRALSEAGVRVPEDVAVVGFDDIEDGRYSTPTLTSISPDKEEIARVAVDLLVEGLGRSGGDDDEAQVNGSVVEPREVFASYELVVRESTVVGGGN